MCKDSHVNKDAYYNSDTKIGTYLEKMFHVSGGAWEVRQVCLYIKMELESYVNLTAATES